MKLLQGVMVRQRIIRSVHIAILIVEVVLLFGIPSEFLQVLDQVAYARMYVAGNVSQGYMSQAEGDRLFQQQEVSLWPFVFQITDVLGVTVVLWKLGTLIKRSREIGPKAVNLHQLAVLQSDDSLAISSYPVYWYLEDNQLVPDWRSVR